MYFKTVVCILRCCSLFSFILLIWQNSIVNLTNWTTLYIFHYTHLFSSHRHSVDHQWQLMPRELQTIGNNLSLPDVHDCGFSPLLLTLPVRKSSTECPPHPLWRSWGRSAVSNWSTLWRRTCTSFTKCVIGWLSVLFLHFNKFHLYLHCLCL